MAEPLSESYPFEALRRTWQPVALSRDLPMNAVRQYQLLNEELVIARMDGGLLAAKNTCTHKGMRLERGCIVDGALQCAYHGWRFDAAGSCLSIPSIVSPTPEKKKLAALKTFATQERYGMVWVRLDAEEIAPLPAIPEF